MPPVDSSPLVAGALLGTATAETVGVVAAVVGAALVGALVGVIVTRRRRPRADPAVAEARLAALWSATRPEPVVHPALAVTVWRLPPDQVLGFVLDALTETGLELVEVTGDRAVLVARGAVDGTGATAVATYAPSVAVDGTGPGLHVRVELRGPDGPAFLDALRRRLVASAPDGGPVTLVQEAAVRAPAGDARR